MLAYFWLKPTVTLLLVTVTAARKGCLNLFNPFQPWLRCLRDIGNHQPQAQSQRLSDASRPHQMVDRRPKTIDQQCWTGDEQVMNRWWKDGVDGLDGWIGVQGARWPSPSCKDYKVDSSPSCSGQSNKVPKVIQKARSKRPGIVLAPSTPLTLESSGCVHTSCIAAWTLKHLTWPVQPCRPRFCAGHGSGRPVGCHGRGWFGSCSHSAERNHVPTSTAWAPHHSERQLATRWNLSWASGRWWWWCHTVCCQPSGISVSTFR